MKSNIKVTFWLNRSKTNKKRLAPVYVRVANGTDIFTMTTGKYVKPSEWSKQSMRLKGVSEESVAINEYLDAFRSKVQRISSQLILSNEPFNVFTIKDMLQGNGKNQIKLVEYFSKCLKDMKSLEGTDYKQTTVIKYTNTRNRLKEFIQKTLKRGDVYLYELNYAFMDDFMRFLKGSYANNQTTCYKHYQRFTKIVRYAVKKGLMDRYPFMDYKIKLPNCSACDNEGKISEWRGTKWDNTVK